MRASLGRVHAMALRHLYLLAGSWPRILELAYWPTMQMILWGFITVFLAEHAAIVARAAGIFLSAVLLWDVLFRSQLGVSVLFLEEMWARHLGHLFVSPLRPFELVLSLFAISALRTLVGVGAAALLALPIHGYWIGDLGLALVAFFANLMIFGWALGLILAALILRLGVGAESLAWAAIFLVQPISGVYYPLEVLPGVLQAVALALPSAYVFEGMRAVLLDGVLRPDLLLWALLANLAWLGLATVVFVALFRSARERGLLLQVGE
jgi:ABC-2 type transport system permease protein